MLKTVCDLCGAEMHLPPTQTENGTILPYTKAGAFCLTHLDMCPNCWTELQAWVDARRKLMGRYPETKTPSNLH
jgi:hypothetical protein